MTCQTGEPYQAFEAPITLLVKRKVEGLYVNFTYQPIVDETGAVGRTMSIGTDANEQVLANKKLEESQQQFRNVLVQALSRVLILKGENLTLEAANAALYKLSTVGPDAIGKPFLEILPEMKEQGFHDLFKNVYHKGEPYFGYETPLYFVRPGTS
jgi:PAS domain-containing protein